MLLVLSLFVCACFADPGLVLSDYLNDPSAGQSAALVNGLPLATPSYSGFFELGQRGSGRFTFFWFFEATNGKGADAPVTTWLQGGPGGSSMFGLFSENGPFSISPNGSSFVAREYAWTNEMNMLYIDNPVGCGFSYTNDPNGFVTNEEQVGKDLFDFATQFFTIFPQFKQNPLVIGGESFAGKYTLAFAHEIQLQRHAGNSSINLHSVAIGDGALDPLIQFTGISEVAYWFSFADKQEKMVLQQYEEQIRQNITERGDFVAAFRAFDAMMNGDFFGPLTYFHNITGLSNYFNMLSPTYPVNPYPAYLNLASTKHMIHVGDGVTYADYNASVEENLIGDWMPSVVPLAEALLEEYPILWYSGQLDVILGSPLCLETLATVQWSGQQGWIDAKKSIWKTSDGEVAGYAKSYGNMHHTNIRKAGHLVPADQPQFAYEMIMRWVTGKGFQ